jgi:crotonobetainyl-CoA:carnitine CoA-transferase CaiB-like acyl-CoA transferase
MRIGDTANDDAARYGKPLDGVRILAIEQMQALPWGTQMLARLGAEVVKVEHPTAGESGRGALPAVLDPEGRKVGGLFIRNNLGKKSVGIDLKKGRELILDMAGKYDVVCENFKAGGMDKMGLGYKDFSARYPHLIYVSVSGFGNTVSTPYDGWPAYAGVAESMSGIYEFSRHEGEIPKISPVGALGDIGSSVFATIGILAALRQRDRTGVGQYLDIAMYDCLVALTDIVTNTHSLGVEPKHGATPGLIMTAFKASDGYFMIQVGREHQFPAFAKVIGKEEWIGDPAFDRSKWMDITETVIRTEVEKWAADKTKRECAFLFANAGVATAPVHAAQDVIDDEHVAKRHMLVEVPRVDGVDTPVLVPGNPIKMSGMQEGPEARMPWLGEHTTEILQADLGLDDARLAQLRADGVIA